MVPILAPAMTESDALGLVDSVNHHFHELYRKTQVYGDMDEDEEGELLCDIEFSLAYGGTLMNFYGPFLTV